MATTIETAPWKSYPLMNDGLFGASFAGPDGKSVLFSGSIRVHRVGGLEEPGRKFVFECRGFSWTSDSVKWLDGHGNTVDPVESEGIRMATEDDYYKVILPAIKRLEKILSAEISLDDVEPVRVGLADHWQYRSRA